MSERPAISVSAALARVNDSLSSLFLTVTGEVSGFDPSKRYSACYFSIKDEDSVMDVKIWRNVYESLGIDISNGMVIEIDGTFGVYAKKGSFSFDARRIRIAGEGQIRARIAALAEQLKREGLMDASTKKSLPQYPEKIALVTSAHGAAVKDVIRTLRRRYPIAEVLFFGTLVEGMQAERDIVHALSCADSACADVVLLVRGGGSFEDLLPFSSESVARAVSSMKTPIVTGIGHEPDTSIADMVADVRASTPTAAAEAVSPAREELVELLQRDKFRLIRGLTSVLDGAQSRLHGLTTRRVLTEPHTLFTTQAMTLDTYHERLQRAIPLRLQNDSMRISAARENMVRIGRDLLDPYHSNLVANGASLEALSPLAVLSRGYAAVFDTRSSRVIDSVKKVSEEDMISLRLSDGTIAASVVEVRPISKNAKEKMRF